MWTLVQMHVHSTSYVLAFDLKDIEAASACLDKVYKMPLYFYLFI